MVVWALLIVGWLAVILLVAFPGAVSDRTAYTVLGTLVASAVVRALWRWAHDETPRRASRGG